MVKRIINTTIVLLLVFILGCSAISELAHASTKTFTGIAQEGSSVNKAVADFNEKVIKSDEAKTVTMSNSPDLIIQNITWSPENPSIGDTVTFSVTVKNQGNSQAGSSRVAYYIDDAFLTSAYVSQIGADNTATKTFTWTAQKGSHTVKAVADLNGEVTESDESNNAKTFAFSVLAPDLIVETITWSSENLSKGDSVPFNVTIKNQGSGKASSSRVYLYIDGSSRGYQDVERLEAGTMVTKTFNWTIQVGSHEIKAIADKDSWVLEDDETNNEKTVTFVTLAPDLIIEAITWSPEEPQKSDNVTFTVSINNQGSGRADYSFVDFYIDGKLLSSASINPIDAGATSNKTFTWIALAGSHEIKAITDSHEKVVEIDETNNEKIVTFSPLPPDLIIQEITWSPENPSKGDRVTFTITIKNQGSGKAGSSRVYLYIDGSSQGYRNVDNLEAGTTVTKTFTWTAQDGPHAIKAVADKESEVPESDETNNEKTVTSSVPPPDLVIETITWSPESPSIGDTVTFMVSVKNHGDGKADYSYVSYYINNDYLTSAYVSQISSNSTDNKTFTWIAQAGSHEIKVVADSNTRVTESDETNNEKVITFFTPAPDLIVRNITWPPESPLNGGTVTFNVTIENQGTSKAGSSRVRFYIDGSSRGYQEIQEIDAGTTVTKTLAWTAQAGSHEIKVVVDSNEEVTESDENNNEKRVTFPAPDLIIRNITLTPENPLLGDTVAFKIVIENQGSSKAGFSRVYLYIDDSSIGYQEIQEIDAGTTVTKTLTWTAQAGSYEIKVIADKDSQVQESDETNNEKIITSTVYFPPESPLTVPIIHATSEGLKEISVNLSGQSTEVTVGQDIVLSLSADNLITNPTVAVQLILELPPGMSVISAGFSESDGGQYSASYSVEPGTSQQIEVHIKTEREGNFDVTGKLIYYFTGGNATAEHQTVSLPITVRNSETRKVEPIPIPSPATGGGLGWWFILVVLALGGLLFMAIKSR